MRVKRLQVIFSKGCIVLTKGKLAYGFIAVLFVSSLLVSRLMSTHAVVHPLVLSGKPHSSSALQAGAGVNSTLGLDPSDAQAVSYADSFYTQLEHKDFQALLPLISNTISPKIQVVDMYRNSYLANHTTLLSYNVFTIDNNLSSSTTKVLLVHLSEFTDGKKYNYTSELLLHKDHGGIWRISGEQPYLKGRA